MHPRFLEVKADERGEDKGTASWSQQAHADIQAVMGLLRQLLMRVFLPINVRSAARKYCLPSRMLWVLKGDVSQMVAWSSAREPGQMPT